MAGNNGSEAPDLMIQILTSIRDEVRSTNGRLERVEGRLEKMDGRLECVEGRLDLHGQALVKIIGELGTLNERFDHFVTGPHRAEHEELRARVERIEQRLDKAG